MHQGVSVADAMPADLMRGAMMKIKSEERDRLAAILADLEQQNDALRYALGSQIWHTYMQ